MCPSKWLTGIKGLLKFIDKDFVNVDPTNKLPINPGPHVAQNTSIWLGSIYFLLNKFIVISCSFSKWERDANSGTTPPCLLWISWEKIVCSTILLCSIRLIEVSSQDVSVAKTSILFPVQYFLLWNNNLIMLKKRNEKNIR